MMNLDYYDKRIRRVLCALNNKNLESLIIFGDLNIFYLTGFYGKDSGSILILTPDKLYLLVHFIYFEEAKNNCVVNNIEVVCYKNKKLEKLSEVLNLINYTFFGLEIDYINCDEFFRVKKLLKKHNKKALKISSLIEDFRKVKDDLEIDYIKRACLISEKALNAIINLNKNEFFNLTEIELSLYIEQIMVKNLSQGRSFDLIVANNDGSSKPHYIPKFKKILPGVTLFDLGCKYNYYCSDITRTIIFKNFSINKSISPNNKKENFQINFAKLEKLYNIVLEAQLLAIEKCKEGITCNELDSISRNYLKKFGYDSYFGHGLGHGVGLNIHESPKILNGSREILLENMVVTIEPGIYIEGEFGIRIEDMVIVKKNNCEVLYNFPKAFNQIIYS